MPEVVVGIDLGGTTVRTVLVSADREILGRDTRPTQADGGLEVVLDVLVQSVAGVLNAAGVTAQDVVAVGIGAPGPMNWRTGVVFSPPNLPGWKDVALGDLMSARLGVPCFVDNDANMACYGEFWSGAGQGVETMCLLTLGTGVGGGVIIDGRLMRGIDGTAAEIGHMKVERDGRVCGCGARGCLEAYGSVTGMVRTAVEGMDAGKETSLSGLSGGDPGTLTGAMISEAAQEGDAFAQWVIRETGVWLGVGISSLINLFNPEKIVLTGGMVQAGPLLLDTIRERAGEDAWEVPAKRAAIVTAALGGDSGAIGAAGTALERYREGQS